MSQRTLLYEDHLALEARMVDFAGWEMPVQYKGLKEEHLNVRNNVGLFDVSHMGEVFVRGEKSLETLQWLTTNDVSKLEEGQAQYTVLPNEKGGIVDDVIVYCLKKGEEYLVCVNASNAKKDFDWMLKNNKGADIQDESSKWSQIAVQGPRAPALLEKIFGKESSEIKPFHFKYLEYQVSESSKSSTEGLNGKVIFAKTGYTGEEGAEIFVPNELLVPLWRELLDKGKEYEVQPIGLGARDTLRLEMKYSLYGHELSDETSPIEAGLGWVVKLNKGDFIGKAHIAKMKEGGPKRKLIGFKMLERGIPRNGYLLFSKDSAGLEKEVGLVTSGTMSPSLGEGIGIAYLDKELCVNDMEFFVDIRGRKIKAKVVPTPFVKKA